MTDSTDQGFAFLPPAAAGLGHVFARPKLIAAGCIVVLTALGWLALAMLIARAGGTFAALCRPAARPLNLTDAALVATMWAAMVLAMMLPSAAPMVLTYAEIADTAARKGERIISPLILAGGYAIVWLGFAALATITQIVLSRAALLDSGLAAASGLFAGAILIAAGLYQFSTLKHACLTQCRSPFPFFFTNWATTPRGVFRLGVKQGLFCVGCCWAMMLVMFAVGTMNVVWMAGLGIVMTAEKIGSGKWFTYTVGIALLAAGAAFALSGLVSHWPGRVI
jgi:predicted metal-binding membrane protein